MVSAKMEAVKMEEFRSNLLLLLQCGYPEGLPMNQLKGEYKQYFMEEVAPELILPRGFKNNKHWDTLFQMKEFREDFTLFYMGTAVYIKAIRKRTFTEMKLIAQLAKHSHLSLVKSADFQCACCPQDMWKQVAKETAAGPLGTNSLNNANYSSGTPVQHHIPSHPTLTTSSTLRPPPLTHVHPSAVEDILVKIEPHQLMTNGDDEENSSRSGGGGTGTTSDGNIYSIVQQATAHGNHSQRANNYVNGATIDASSSSTSNTNDGFMLDHQLRVQEQSTSPHGQSLQAFASLLNSTGTGGSIPVPNTDGSSGQPFYTFVIQNGEIKVMQIVSSEGATANGEASSVITSPGSTPVTVVTPSSTTTAKKSQSHKRAPGTSLPPPESPVVPASRARDNNENFPCSMPGCEESFVIKQHLQNHERTCSMKKYPCLFPGCDRRFKNSKQRHAHMTSRHKGTGNEFRCTVPQCTAVFKTNERLKVHESRCRFKYEQFQLMDLDALEAEAAANNNNQSFPTPSNHTPVVPNLNSTITVGSVVEPQCQQQLHSEPNAAFECLQQAASIIAERVVVSNSTAHHSPLTTSVMSSPVKLENGNQSRQVQHSSTTGEFQGFSTVDLSLVKSESME